jgi:hypothetical protein
LDASTNAEGGKAAATRTLELSPQWGYHPRHPGWDAALAQLVEHRIRNAEVVSSSLTSGTIPVLQESPRTAPQWTVDASRGRGAILPPSTGRESAMSNQTDISGRQFAAARALLRMSLERLSRVTGIDESALASVEANIVSPPGPPDTVEKMRKALEDNGIRFIPDNGGGEGVRLKFSRSEAKRISTLEGEGGIVANDDV